MGGIFIMYWKTAPLCPLHNKRMTKLPRLPQLKQGRSTTSFALKLRREFNSVLRFRCPVPGCACVAAISNEFTD